MVSRGRQSQLRRPMTAAAEDLLHRRVCRRATKWPKNFLHTITSPRLRAGYAPSFPSVLKEASSRLRLAPTCPTGLQREGVERLPECWIGNRRRRRRRRQLGRQLGRLGSRRWRNQRNYSDFWYKSTARHSLHPLTNDLTGLISSLAICSSFEGRGHRNTAACAGASAMLTSRFLIPRLSMHSSPIVRTKRHHK